MGGIALKSYILIGGSSSSVVPSIRGVPHGSILGPRLIHVCGHYSFKFLCRYNFFFWFDILVYPAQRALHGQENDTACEYSFKNLFWKQTPNIKSFRNLRTIKCAFVTSCHLIFSSSRRRIIMHCFEHMDSYIFFIFDTYRIISICDIHRFGI